MDDALDYAGIYKTLNTGSKRGFLRKSTNETFNSDYATCISKNLAGQDCYELAAEFLLGKAKGENNLNDTLTEASTLVTAAKYFVKAQNKLDRINSANYEEYLDSAQMCLLRAAKIYESNEMSTLSVDVYNFLSDTLMSHAKFTQALVYLCRAYEIMSGDFARLHILFKMFACKIHMSDYHGALNDSVKLQLLIESEDRIRNSYSDYWNIAEIYRVCLVLLTRPSSKLSEAPDSLYSLKQYAISLDSPVRKKCDLPMDTYINLQSLIIAFQSRDVLEMENASSSLLHHMTPDQHTILHRLFVELTTVSSAPTMDWR